MSGETQNGKMSAEELARLLQKLERDQYGTTAAMLRAHIAAIQREADEMREALEPFAKAADIRLCGQWRDDQSIQATDVCWHITFGHLRRARAALAKARGE